MARKTNPPTDANANSIDALVRLERLDDAAELALRQGDPTRASGLFERACMFERAANASRVAGDHKRAFELGARACDLDHLDSLTRFANELTVEQAANMAPIVSSRGQHAAAALAWERASSPLSAAGAWDRAGEAIRAATNYENEGALVDAARVLERAIEQGDPTDAHRFALGNLLLRHGKWEGALRQLQRIADASALHAEAQEKVTFALRALGHLPHSEIIPPAAHVGASLLFGRYEVVREVASTANARVLECTDRLTGQRVALKMLAFDPVSPHGRDALVRFEREVHILMRVNHPRIVPMLDYMKDGPAIALAWMGGGTLDDVMAKIPLTPARACEIALSVLHALAEAHRLGIIHRDIKPSNVLFDDAGAAHLSDFGAAHIADASRTVTAAIIGSHGTMSPEQQRGEPATIRSDLYSVGIVFRTMLVGAQGFTHQKPSHVHANLSALHDEAIAMLCAEAADDRPPNAAEAYAALTRLSWPNVVELQNTSVTMTVNGPQSQPKERYEHSAQEGWTDRWLATRVSIVDLTDANLTLARAFAKALHPGLQRILRTDATRLFVEATAAESSDAVWNSSDATWLRSALAALHKTGCVHGNIDESHIFRTRSGILRLRFPTVHRASTAERDAADLDLLIRKRSATNI